MQKCQNLKFLSFWWLLVPKLKNAGRIFRHVNHVKYHENDQKWSILDQIWWISIILTIYWILLLLTLNNDHFLIDFEFLATYESKVANFYHADFQNLRFLHIRWPFWGYHIQVMNVENDPNGLFLVKNWPKLGQKWPFFGHFLIKNAIFLQNYVKKREEITKNLEIF